MHKDFSDWYRTVSIEHNGAVLTSRWAGVEEWCSRLLVDDEAILETVRIFQGLPAVISREPFLTVFRKHDPAFPQRNELELRVLAGAALVRCVNSADDDGGSEGARAAVIAGTALEASLLRTSDPQLGEVAAAVLGGLHDVARCQRERRPFSTALINDKHLSEAREAMKLVPTASDWSVLRGNVQPILQAVLNGVLRAQVVLANVAHNLRCADEETDILWWLEGGCSRDVKKPWGALEDEVPLLAGWELADLTDIALGPRDATAFLNRVVTLSKGRREDQPFEVYVNAVTDDWAKMRTAGIPDRALDLAPVTLALLQRAKSGTASWQQYFERTGGVGATRPLAPVVVAKQAYVEAVMLRTLAERDE